MKNSFIIFTLCFCLSLMYPVNGQSKKDKEVSTVKIASLSFVPVKWNKKNNLEKIEAMTREAAANGAKIIITAEGALEGYLIDFLRKADNRQSLEKDFFEIAEPVDGPSVTHILNLAKELNIDIILGFLERDGEILYNSVSWINSKGKIIHIHHKTHMAQPYFEPQFYHPGDIVEAFDTDYGRFGMMICFERQIPEVAGALVFDGAQVIFNPSYGSRGEWNDTMLRTRARDNQVPLIFTHPLQTLVIDAKGEVSLDIKDKEGIYYSEIDIGSHNRKKIRQRRPKVFIDKLSRKNPPSSGLEFDIPSIIEIQSEDDAVKKRKDFINALFGPEGFPFNLRPNDVEHSISDPDFDAMPNLKRIDKLTIEMDWGLNSIAYHFIPLRSNKQAVIYHQGHNGKFSLGRKTISAFLEKGYDVIGLSMPIMGMNRIPIVNLKRFGKMIISKHDWFCYLTPKSGHPVRYFIDPVACAVNYLEKFDFKNIIMIGISGGGWTTTLCAAIDPRIGRSYPVAGSHPNYLRVTKINGKNSIGDYEQYAPDLYRVANYLELYILGSYGQNRGQLQILNEFDTCCFFGTGYTTYEDIVKKRVKNLGKGSYDIFLDSSHQEHKISDQALEVVFKDLKNND